MHEVLKLPKLFHYMFIQKAILGKNSLSYAREFSLAEQLFESCLGLVPSCHFWAQNLVQKKIYSYKFIARSRKILLNF